MAGNSSQNENTFLQKIPIGLLYYDPLASVFNIQPNTLYFVCLIYFFWAATAPYYDRKKKVLVVCLAGA